MQKVQQRLKSAQKKIISSGAENSRRFYRPLTLYMVSFMSFCSVCFSQPEDGEMLRFDGNDDHIPIGNLLPSGSYTKEVWISAGFFGSSTSNLVSGTSTAFWAPNGRLRAGHSISNAFNDVEVPAINTMSNNVWYHVAVTYDAGTNLLTLYQNGVALASGTATGTYAESNLFIGALKPDADPVSLYEGRLDEVRIWNVVRTPTEIANTWNCELTGDERGLVAHYDFNQGISDGDNPTVTTLFDRADKCFPTNGTLLNFALFGGSSNWSAPGAPPVVAPCAGTFPNIRVNGNNECILDGDVSPGPLDHTDYGAGTARTYTILNTGTATLNISSVTITGANATEFSVTTPPASSVAVSGSTTFTITFTPSSVADKFATINVNNDDPDESPYSFDVYGLATLPVQLISFTVKKVASHSQLNWITASETNNLGFDLLRSSDSRNWIPIGFVPGAGTSTTERSYSYTDQAPKKGINYYRLRQLEINNKETLSEIRAVTFAGYGTLVYPVPTKDNIVIEIADPGAIGSVATISDQQGRLVRRFTVSKMQQTVSLADLPAGIYLLRMDDGVTQKLIKQ